MANLIHLFGNIGEGAFIVDTQQKIVHWNEEATKLLGYSAAEALGKRCWELLQGRTSSGRPFCGNDCHVLSRALNGTPVHDLDVLFTHRDGRRLLCNISTLPIPEEQRSGDAAMVHLLRCRLPAEPALLRVKLLGGVRVWRPDGGEVTGRDWRRTKVRALLALLAEARGRPLGREEVVELLWPDKAYDSGLANLNTTVYQLRRSLEPALEKPADSRYIRYEGGVYHLPPELASLDVVLFDELLAQAERATTPAERIRHFNAACALYQGEYLADLASLPLWDVGESIRLRELFLAGLETLGLLYEAQGDPERAAATYLRALAADPCRETATQKLMRLLLGQGDRAGAAVHCLRLLENMRQDLGMETSPETQELCRIAGCSKGAWNE